MSSSDESGIDQVISSSSTLPDRERHTKRVLGKRGLQEFLVVDHTANLRKMRRSGITAASVDASMMTVWLDTDPVSSSSSSPSSPSSFLGPRLALLRKFGYGKLYLCPLFLSSSEPTPSQ